MLPPISSSWPMPIPMPIPIPVSASGIPPVGIDVLGVGVVRGVRRLVVVRLDERERAAGRLARAERERPAERLLVFLVDFFAPDARLPRPPDFLALDDRLVGISLLDRK